MSVYAYVSGCHRCLPIFFFVVCFSRQATSASSWKGVDFKYTRTCMNTHKLPENWWIRQPCTVSPTTSVLHLCLSTTVAVFWAQGRLGCCNSATTPLLALHNSHDLNILASYFLSYSLPRNISQRTHYRPHCETEHLDHKSFDHFPEKTMRTRFTSIGLWQENTRNLQKVTGYEVVLLIRAAPCGLVLAT